MSSYDSIGIYNIGDRILTQFCLSPEVQTLCDIQPCFCFETWVLTYEGAEFGTPKKTYSAAIENNRKKRIRFVGRPCMELGRKRPES